MKRRDIVVVLCFVAAALALVGGSCDVARTPVKLSDLDHQLQGFQNGKWDGVKNAKISYVTGIDKHVVDWDKQSAVTYASLAHAQHVAQIADKSVEALKTGANAAAVHEAQHQVKLAQSVLQKAVDNAPKLIKEGKDLATNYRSVVSDPLQAPKVIEALKESLNNLSKTVERAPDLIKKLGQMSLRLAKL